MDAISPIELKSSGCTKDQVDGYIEQINNSLLLGRVNISEPDECYYSSHTRECNRNAFNVALSKFREAGWKISVETSTGKFDEGRQTYIFSEG